MKMDNNFTYGIFFSYLTEIFFIVCQIKNCKRCKYKVHLKNFSIQREILKCLALTEFH